ncbi:MAG: hypothetical protein WD638_00130 [Nitriliruptoraceae bacterium]
MRRWSLLMPVLALVLAACTDDGPVSIDEQAADLSDELGDGWETDIVEDDRDGTFLLSRPVDAEVWIIGEPTEPIASLTADTAWAGFWLPALEAASADRSNIRAVVADTATVPGSVVSWQVNVNAHDPSVELAADELVDDLRQRFEGQDLEVVEARTAEWEERTIAFVAFEVPAETFGGEERVVRQWFIADDAAEAMWSFSCDAPADHDATEEACRTGLDGFRPTPPASDDVAA